MEVCRFLLEQVCKMKLKMGRGDYFIWVLSSVKGDHLRSFRCGQEHKADWCMELAWPFISPGNTMGKGPASIDLPARGWQQLSSGN